MTVFISQVFLPYIFVFTGPENRDCHRRNINRIEFYPASHVGCRHTTIVDFSSPNKLKVTSVGHHLITGPFPRPYSLRRNARFSTIVPLIDHRQYHQSYGYYLSVVLVALIYSRGLNSTRPWYFILETSLHVIPGWYISQSFRNLH